VRAPRETRGGRRRPRGCLAARMVTAAPSTAAAAALLLHMTAGVMSGSSSSSSALTEQVWLLVDPLVTPSAAAAVDAGWWEVVLPTPKKEASNPLLVEDQLWDLRWDNTYPTTRFDAEAGLYKVWWNAFVGNFHPHPKWASQNPGLSPPPKSSGLNSATLYATSRDGINWTKPKLDVVDYKWNGTAPVSVGKNNMLLLAAGNPDRGVMYDSHDSNHSRRYKAFGSWWGNLCRDKNSTTPVTAHDGTQWPPCHNLGVAFSADGVHFDHAQAEDSFFPGNAPGLNVVGQNDGALDLAMWDQHLGSYWGLVRLDVNIKDYKNCDTGGSAGTTDCTDGFRRTGRFETKDFKTFTAGEQVFHGRKGYEIYTIQPFRLASYRPGYYLATAMFYNTTRTATEGYVNCELLQSTNYGRNWSRIAHEGTQYIPRGDHGQFDSHTLYTAWTGDSGAMLDPTDAETTLFYYVSQKKVMTYLLSHR
jgi:hypothetical protein